MSWTPYEFPDKRPKLGQTVRYCTRSEEADDSAMDAFDTIESVVLSRRFDWLAGGVVIEAHKDTLVLFTKEQAEIHGLDHAGWYADRDGRYEAVYEFKILAPPDPRPAA